MKHSIVRKLTKIYETKLFHRSKSRHKMEIFETSHQENLISGTNKFIFNYAKEKLAAFVRNSLSISYIYVKTG